MKQQTTSPEYPASESKLKHRISILTHHFRALALWQQLTLLMAITSLVPVIIAFSLVYLRSANTIVENECSVIRDVLDFEIDSLETYTKELMNAASQPLYDSKVNAVLTQRTPLTQAQKSLIAEQCSSYYYSRSDINSFRLYLIEQNQLYHRSAKIYRFEDYDSDDFLNGRLYTNCSERRYFHDIAPSAGNSLLYSHALINLKTGKPYAILSFEVNEKFLDNMPALRRREGFFCLYNDEDQLLVSTFSGLPAKSQTRTDAAEPSSNPANAGKPGTASAANNTETNLTDAAAFEEAEDSRKLPANNAGAKLVNLKGNAYLKITSKSDRYGFYLVDYMPYDSITAKLRKNDTIGILWGLFVWLVLTGFAILCTHAATRPITSLAERLHRVGEGEFSRIEENYASREAALLTEDYNYMVTHIESLIKDNYVSQLNEKNARLIALEAQLNPHFLYNTLQAIGTEALINDQPQIYKMLTNMASLMRYTIKEGDLVPLSNELEHSQNYIFLQKLRSGSNLDVSFDIPDELLKLPVPKISLQLLLENSIVHGRVDASSVLRIEVRIRAENGLLTITVTDNGCGIPKDHLEELQKQFSEAVPLQSSTVGLMNLANRLMVLYDTPGTLRIESEEGLFTRVTITIPVSPDASFRRRP